MGTTIVERELVCKLGDAEVLERGDSMADAELAIDRLKDDRRQLNARIREQSDLRAKLAHAIESRTETRLVSCEWSPDYARKVWLLRRIDTGAPLEERQMTAADLQERLLPDANDEPAPPRRKRKREDGANAKRRPKPLAAV